MTPSAGARRLVGAEIMKLRTTRAWWLFIGGFALVTALVLARNALGTHYELFPQPDTSDRAQALLQAAQDRTPGGVAVVTASLMTSGQTLTVLFALLLGSYVITSEYGNRTVTVTFLTVPRRERVVAAKLAAAASLGALFWLIATVVNGVVVPVFMASQHLSAPLTAMAVVRSVALSLPAFILWAAFGLGLGAVIRSPSIAVFAGLACFAGGFAAVAGASQLLFNLVHQDWLFGARVIAPAVASQVMITSGRAFPHAPPQWVGAVVMTGYGVALTAVGIIQTRRRDVT
jgi:ABC-type transport system involved in multi-copper enzyme maturation permease subunit